MRYVGLCSWCHGLRIFRQNQCSWYCETEQFLARCAMELKRAMAK